MFGLKPPHFYLPGKTQSFHPAFHFFFFFLWTSLCRWCSFSSQNWLQRVNLPFIQSFFQGIINSLSDVTLIYRLLAGKERCPVLLQSTQTRVFDIKFSILIIVKQFFRHLLGVSCLKLCIFSLATGLKVISTILVIFILHY